MNGEALISRIAEPLYQAKGWMKFVSVLAIIQGIVTIFSIWGILVCWIPIWMGAVLCSASNQVRIAFETNNEEVFKTSLGKLATYFRIAGVLAVIVLVIAIIGLLAAILLPALLAAQKAAAGN